MHFGEQFLDVNSSTLIALVHAAGGRAPGGTWSVFQVSSIDEKSLDETDDHIRCRRNTTTSSKGKKTH